jgi:hypothetical protein
MNDSNESKTDAAADFLKSWTESFSRILQSACNFAPDTMPPEMMRQIRTGIFQALAKSWEEFMRSPQFLEGMKQMMDNAIAFRQMTGEFFAKARHETQGVNREDVDGVLLAVREMEARLTRRVEELASQITPGRGQQKTTDATRPPSGQKGRHSRQHTSSRKGSSRKTAAKQN